MKITFLLFSLLVINSIVIAQNVGVGTNTPDASAQLDISSTGKGLLIPRVTTTQMKAIASPAKGLMVFNTTDSSLFIKRDTGWTKIVAGLADNFWGIKNGNLYNSNNGNVGIGVDTAKAGLHIIKNGGIIAKGDTLSDNSYVLTETGPGAKLIWHPKKAAFIAGRLDNFGDVPYRWDEDSIGFGAMNLGYANKVKGQYSFATGIGNVVSGGGFGSIAMGHNSLADSNECVAIGFGAEARQRQAMAIGTGVVANGRSSFATGYFSYAGGFGSTVGGYGNNATGDYSFSTGYVNYSGAPNSFTSGYNNSIFDFSSPDGGAKAAAAFGWANSLRGAFSFAAGTFNTIDSAGYNSLAVGYGNRTGNNETVALGNSNYAVGKGSIAMGTGNTTYGDYSIALGQNAIITAAGISSMALGKGAQAACTGCIVMGSPLNNETNVGIGTNNPSHARLEVNNVIGNTVGIFGADRMGIALVADNPAVGFNYFYNNGAKTIKAGYAAEIEMTPQGDLFFVNFNNNQSATDFGTITGAANRMVIKQDGNIGMGGPGSTNPSATLDVRKNGTTTLVNLKGTDNFSHFMFGPNEDTYIRAGKNGSSVLINDIPNGKTGVGTSSPLTTLHLKMLYSVNPDGLMLERDVNNKWITGVDFANDYSFYIYNGSTYPYKGYIDHVSGTYNSLSDKTLKKDIESLNSNSGLSLLMQLNPVRYHFQSSDRKQYDYGFISQEVEKLAPDFVTEKDGIKMLGYNNFIPVAIKSIQEQQVQIETLQKENNDLKVRLERLEKLLLKN
jgi:Chaperone of endosialidase/Head domain of trimeric autotransporter adhesin